MSKEQTSKKHADVYLLKVSETVHNTHADISRKGRDLLAYALLQHDIKEVPSLTYGPHGKPYLPEETGLFFNISHSGEYIALIISHEECGIDLQKMEGKRSDRLVRRIFSDEELAAYERLQESPSYFFERWVLKEAFVKCSGEGITRSLKGLPDRGWNVLLEAPAGYAMAVSSRDPLNIAEHRIDHLP